MFYCFPGGQEMRRSWNRRHVTRVR